MTIERKWRFYPAQNMILPTFADFEIRKNSCYRQNRRLDLFFRLSLLIAVVLISSCASPREVHNLPRAVDGIMDLRNWDFENDGTIYLNGRWSFYWRQLIPPGTPVSSLPKQSGYIHVPGRWNGFLIQGREIDGDGYATYRLRVQLPRKHGQLAFKLQGMATAYRLWVDNQLVFSNGRVASTPDAMRPQYYPGIALVKPLSDKMTLTLQVSNFRHRKGGAWEPIKLGEIGQIRGERAKKLAFELLLFGALLIMALYHMVMFITRRVERASFYFSLVCLWAAFRTIMVGERFFIILFPGFNWELFQKLEYISFYLVVPSFVMFIVALFNEYPKRLAVFTIWVGLVFSGFTLITPVRIFSYGMLYFQVLVILLAVHSIYIFYRIFINRREGAATIFLGFIILMITVLIDMLAENELIPSYNLGPLGLFMFVFCYATVLSVRFSNAMTKAESLSVELQHTNLEKDVYLRALEESEKKYRELVENLDDVFFTVDNNGRFNYLSPAAERVFGHKPDELLGTSCTDYVHPEEKASLFNTFAKIQKGESGYLDCRVFAKSGEMYWVQLNVRPLVASGKLLGAQGFISDITERRRTEQLMFQTEKMASVGGLAAGMAHELNNPLAGILLAVQNIIRRLKKDLKSNIKAARECQVDLDRMNDYLDKRDINYYLAGIKESGERASEIIRNMLHFSRKSGSKKASCSVVTLLENAVELARTDYNLKKDYDFRKVGVKRYFHEDVPDIYCNKTEIEQVFFNLLKNAAQAMADHDPEGQPAIFLRLSREKRFVRIEIEDNGPGMGTNQQKKIFEPFYTTKPEGVGTGLGLSVSYMIITKNHQGSIEVDSEPEKGTRFIIQLPISQEKANPE